jgi:hypothetical protein
MERSSESYVAKLVPLTFRLQTISLRNTCSLPNMPRWSTENNKQLASLFEEGKADPENKTPTYIKNEVWAKNKWLQRSPTVKNFYPIYRRKAAKWITEQAKSGSRRKYRYIVFACLVSLALYCAKECFPFYFFVYRCFCTTKLHSSPREAGDKRDNGRR